MWFRVDLTDFKASILHRKVHSGFPADRLRAILSGFETIAKADLKMNTVRHRH